MPKKLKSDCFKIVNKNGEPVLFRTDDVTINKFTFTITNLTGEPLSLTGGVPVKLVKGLLTADPGGSTFSFSFESMLTAEVVKNLKLTLPAGWHAAFFEAKQGTPASWSIAPEANVVIPVNDAIKVEIENIKCATTQPGNFEIMYRNIPGYADALFPIDKHLSVLNPPDDRKQKLPLEYGYINPVHPIQGQTVGEEEFNPVHVIHAAGGEAVPVYITYDPAALIQNGFTLILTSTSKNPLVQAESPFDFLEEAAAEPPVAYISFLFGEEEYAITTQQLADNNISIDINAKLPWQPSAHGGGNSYWEFRPQSQQIMLGYETISFPIKKIITPLNVLPVDAISIMNVQVNNIPGYNDNVYTLQLQKKKAKARLEDFSVNKRTIEIGEDVTLTWKSSLAKRVTIDYKNRDDETIMLDSEKGEIKLDGKDFKLPVAPSAQTTVITVTAYDDSTGTSSLERTITVNQQPAFIKSLNADPPLADIGTSVDISFTWEVSNAKKLLLVTPEGEKDVTKKTGYIYKGLNAAFRFTLKAFSYYHMAPETVSMATDVFAFRTEKSVPLPMPVEKMQPQPSVLINKQLGRVYVANNTNNTVYDIDINKLSVDRQYPGNVILLSANGSTLFVFNPDPNYKVFGTVLYETATGHGSRNFNIYSQVAGPFPGISMLVTPDLKKYYCSVDFKVSSTHYINIQRYNVDDHWMTYDDAVTSAGDRIWTISFNNNVDKLYVAHNTKVEVRKLSDRSWSKLLPLPGSGPTMFVCNKSGAKLYLACDGGNVIAVIDTTSDSINHWITLKNKPVYLAISADDKYLFASIYDTNEVAVINTATNEIVSTIVTGKSPYGIALDAGAELLFTANYCAKTLSVFDLKNNRMLSSKLATGADKGNPLDVGLYEDKDGNIKVFVSKEAYPQRIACAGDTKNTALDVSVFSILKPKNR